MTLIARDLTLIAVLTHYFSFLAVDSHRKQMRVDGDYTIFEILCDFFFLLLIFLILSVAIQQLKKRLLKCETLPSIVETGSCSLLLWIARSIGGEPVKVMSKV